MFVPFESLPPTSRVWIFQADKPLTADQLPVAEARLRQFTDDWMVHGVPLPTSYTIRFGQFIVLAADETHQNTSGCSIDSSVRALKEVEALLGIELFDRNLVAFRPGKAVMVMPLNEVKQKFQQGILNAETPAFNNLVSTKREFEENWLVPAGKTWLKRYIPNTLEKVK
jgi:hypothetical protein